ncbi:hypothetical protein Pmani_035302 [Petrolisthes manimaculis]|uniref:Replication protein A subunit n=1 Tax=Petrolisthes manimaculis TaxID=1843537 RepID=A0AAE1NMM6_9EUCA|nr:hypothetical protein Pmani_035302 [Petrolisthes manimaculis]
MNQLTSGVIADIIEGGHPDNPLVQILSMKRIPSGSQERWRLLVSDSQWSCSFAMLATQLNNKVSSGEITNNCIVRLDRYVCNMIQDNKKVLIILDLTITKSGEEVGGKIGEPVLYDANKTRAQQQPVAKPPPSQNQTYANKPISNNNMAGSGGSLHQNGPGQRNFASTGASQARTPSGGNVNPIASLTPYQNRWTICARVTNKSNIRTWSNSRGEGKLFSVDLLDESGEIRATGFNEQCDKFYDMMEINKVFFITSATLKTANKQYSNLNNEYEMSFNRTTEVTSCHESSAIPTMQFSFVSFDQLETLDKDSIVDVIGVCKETLDMSSVTQRSTGRELKKRDLQLLDSTNREVRLTLWGSQAETFDGSAQPIVAVKGAKVSDFNGCSLSTLSTSCFQLNPDIREAHMLKGWFDNGGNTADTINLSGQKGGMGGGGPGNFKMFAEAQMEKLGTTKPDYYWVTAGVLLIKKENCLYPACPQKECNKKVVDMNNGLYRCEKCNREYDSFKWRLMIQTCIADYTDSQWVTLFQDTGEALIGKSAEELASLRDTNPDSFQSVFDAPALQFYDFKLRCNTEMYNDRQSWKNTVVAANLTNPKEQNRRLITEIKQMAGQS